MQAVTWHGTGDGRVEKVPDFRMEEPTDAIIRVTSAAMGGSDLHPYGMDTDKGDILGHEALEPR